MQAVDYLLKPISFERLLQDVNKYLGKSIAIKSTSGSEIIQEKSDFIFVRADRKMIKINFSEIHFIESLSDYVKIQLQDNAIVTKETISNIEAKLPKNDFTRIHRLYIVSITSINSFTNEFIEVNNKALSISRSYKKDVLFRLENV